MTNTSMPSSSISREIGDLFALFKEGALTQNEFDTIKGLLLNRLNNKTAAVPASTSTLPEPSSPSSPSSSSSSSSSSIESSPPPPPPPPPPTSSTPSLVLRGGGGSSNEAPPPQQQEQRSNTRHNDKEQNDDDYSDLIQGLDLRELASLSYSNSDNSGNSTTAAQSLIRILTAIVEDDTNQRLRRLNLAKGRVAALVEIRGVMPLLQQIGFVLTESDEGHGGRGGGVGVGDPDDNDNDVLLPSGTGGGRRGRYSTGATPQWLTLPLPPKWVPDFHAAQINALIRAIAAIRYAASQGTRLLQEDDRFAKAPTLTRILNFRRDNIAAVMSGRRSVDDIFSKSKPVSSSSSGTLTSSLGINERAMESRVARTVRLEKEKEQKRLREPPPSTSSGGGLPQLIDSTLADYMARLFLQDHAGDRLESNIDTLRKVVRIHSNALSEINATTTTTAPASTTTPTDNSYDNNGSPQQNHHYCRLSYTNANVSQLLRREGVLELLIYGGGWALHGLNPETRCTEVIWEAPSSCNKSDNNINSESIPLDWAPDYLELPPTTISTTTTTSIGSSPNRDLFISYIQEQLLPHIVYSQQQREAADRTAARETSEALMRKPHKQG